MRIAAAAVVLVLSACTAQAPHVTEDLDPNRTDGGAAESTCERVVSAFLEIEDGHDRTADLDFAIEACESIDAVEAAADLLGDRLDSARLFDTVRERCETNPDLAASAICRDDALDSAGQG